MSEDAHNPDGSPPSYLDCQIESCLIVADYKRATADLLTMPGYVTYRQQCPICKRITVWNEPYLQVFRRVVLRDPRDLKERRYSLKSKREKFP